jgi:hypothetical protein
MMATLSRMFPWREALVNVKPDTLIRWHRKGFRLFWLWKSKPSGRPRLAKYLRQLIREMAVENSTWGEERIANELKLRGLAVRRGVDRRIVLRQADFARKHRRRPRPIGRGTPSTRKKPPARQSFGFSRRGVEDFSCDNVLKRVNRLAR